MLWSLKSTPQDHFAAVDTWDASLLGDALDDYLAAPALGSVTNCIVWWLSFGRDGLLCRMTLNFHSTPASLVDIKRAFSCGGLTVSKLCHWLTAEFIWAATVLNLWSKYNNLVPEELIIKVFTEKRTWHSSNSVIDIDVHTASDERSSLFWCHTIYHCGTLSKFWETEVINVIYVLWETCNYLQVLAQVLTGSCAQKLVGDLEVLAEWFTGHRYLYHRLSHRSRSAFSTAGTCG